VNPTLCQTAELPLGNLIGSRLEHDQNHIIQYRQNGMCHWSPSTSKTPTLDVPVSGGYLYMPYYWPPERGGRDRAVGLVVYLAGPVNVGGGSKIEWSPTFSGALTGILDEDYALTDVPGEMRFALEYTPQAGTGATGIECMVFKFTNLDVTMASVYNLSNRYDDEDEYWCAPGDCAPGRYIVDDTWSMRGLCEAVANAADNVESMERLTRRMFFNQSHFAGSFLDGADAAGTVNMLGYMQFSPRVRDLLTGENTANCIPAAVIMATGQDGVGAGEISLTYYSTASAESWKYTVQSTDSTTDPIFVHPWSTGSSSSNGLSVRGLADDSIEIRGLATDATETLTLLGWALIEGGRLT
jgi:hypothetical protein